MSSKVEWKVGGIVLELEFTAANLPPRVPARFIESLQALHGEAALASMRFEVVDAERYVYEFVCVDSRTFSQQIDFGDGPLDPPMTFAVPAGWRKSEFDCAIATLPQILQLRNDYGLIAASGTFS